MTRQAIREMKRGLAAGTAQGASTGAQVLAKDMALGLLDRSIRFGHGRLAVIRLAMAVKSGAEISEAHWLYCRDVALDRSDGVVKALFLEAVRSASARAPAQVH